MKINRDELLNASVLVLFGAWIWWYSSGFPNLEEGYPGPALFPRLISAGFILSGLILPWTSKSDIAMVQMVNTDRKGVLRLLGGLALVILYPLLQPYLTFAPTLGIICFGVALLLGVRLWVAGLTALGAVGFIFLTFKQLLGVSL